MYVCMYVAYVVYVFLAMCCVCCDCVPVLMPASSPLCCRLLQAALMAIKSGLIGDTIEYKLLLERFYATAFDYFW